MTPVKSPDDTVPLERFRATVNLADAHVRVRAGNVIYADPTIPYVAERLDHGWLIRDPEPDAASD